MIHHVALEVGPELMEAEGEFWVVAGFERVPVPEALGSGYDWYEAAGTQIHLMETAEPAVPPRRGHLAVVATDMAESLARLEDGGFAVTEGRRLWGERRVKVTSPAGNVVEFMAAPPPPASGG